MNSEKLAKRLLVSPTMRRSSYVLRLVAGMYLLYLMYQLFDTSSGSGEPLTPVMIAAGVVMVVAGVYFVIGALYALSHGIYEENDPAQLAELEALSEDAGAEQEVVESLEENEKENQK